MFGNRQSESIETVFDERDRAFYLLGLKCLEIVRLNEQIKELKAELADVREKLQSRRVRPAA